MTNDALETELRRAAAELAAAGDDRCAGERLAARAADEHLLHVRYASLDTPVGRLLLAATAGGLLRISYSDSWSEEEVLADLARTVSPRLVEAPALLDPARRELDEYFEGRRTAFDLPLDWRLVRGFGRRVLQATARIPFGEVSTYGEIAARAGSPRASRATGNALGANPLPIVVPCHRVLRAGGALGGYTGGLDRKRRLLAIEGRGML
jgi:methylated-DNA-[protein]-cysteine S-methyltransferase